MAHSAQNYPLEVSFRVSTVVGKRGSESEFEILLWALTMYREHMLDLADKNRDDADQEQSDYREYLETVQTINEMTTSIAGALCSADQKRIKGCQSEQAD